VAARIVANEREGSEDLPVGNLAASRDFTDVRDVVRAYRLMVERGVAGEAYNVCSGTAVPIQEVAQSLLDLARHPMRLVVDPDRYRPVDNPMVLGDPSRLQAATGWAPAISLHDTLVDLLAHWRQVGDQG
jgi:GDP-4-dehydro-6-deoxy-D-mannose reductase